MKTIVENMLESESEGRFFPISVRSSCLYSDLKFCTVQNVAYWIKKKYTNSIKRSGTFLNGPGYNSLRCRREFTRK